MIFKIKWEEKILSFLDKLDYLLSKRIVKKVDELENDPFSKNIKKLKNSDNFRLRVGDYRVILDIDLGKKIITILKIGHRKNIYLKNI